MAMKKNKGRDMYKIFTVLTVSMYSATHYNMASVRLREFWPVLTGTQWP